MKTFTVTLIAAALLTGALLAGCNSSPAPSSGATQSAEGIQKQIDAINAKTDMPQQAKDALIAQLQQAKAQTEAAAQQSATASQQEKAATKQ